MPINIQKTELQKQTEKAELLIQEGRNFNYENFAPKTEHGFASSLSSNYLSWKIKVESLLVKLFGDNSAIYKTYVDGDNVSLIGYGHEAFTQQHSTIIAALLAAVDELQYQPEPLQKEQSHSEFSEKEQSKSKEVFVVHGHDEQMKHELEIFLQEIGLKPIVLHRQVDEGQTIIEKFEKHSKVGYAFILATPDDIGYSKSEDVKVDQERVKEPRARQNVIFEWGFFVGKLGRNRVCCLLKKGVTPPSDLSGIVYKEVATTIESVGYAITKELKAAGYSM